jgi:CreA protein
MSAVRWSAVAILIVAPAAHADEVGCTSTTFRIFGANDKICVQAFDDPRVPGVSVPVARWEGR